MTLSISKSTWALTLDLVKHLIARNPASNYRVVQHLQTVLADFFILSFGRLKLRLREFTMYPKNSISWEGIRRDLA